MTQAQEFERLYDLRQKGILTPEEFDAQRAAMDRRYEMTYSAPTIGFKDAYRSYWKNSFRWRGRATRAEFWWPQLVNMIISFLFGFFSGLTHSAVFPILSIVFTTLIIFPGLAVWVRRSHDFGKSAWFAFKPMIINICLVLFLAIFAVGCQIIDYATRDNPLMWFKGIRSLIFILGGFGMIALTFFYILVWPYIIGLLPGQDFPNKYGDKR